MRSDTDTELWATIRNELVTDASLSVRKQKVKLGMQGNTALAFVPNLQLIPEEDTPSLCMQTVWNQLWSFTPWLETVGMDGFFLQLPGEDAPPLTEIRDMLCVLDEGLLKEQRFRVGVAENPFLARALVEWSRVERVPGALYRKAKRQHLIISPALAECDNSDSGHRLDSTWIRKFPIKALWTLSERARDSLLQLGLHRLADFEEVPQGFLRKHFGKESILWPRLLQQEAGGKIAVNYPPVSRREVWQSALGEGVEISLLGPILHSLLQPLAIELERAGAGALRVAMEWETDTSQGCFERVAKRPVYREESLYAQIQPGIEECSGRLIERVQVSIQDIRPLASVQMSFVIHKGALVPVDELSKTDVQKLIQQVNRKFPRGLQVGLRSNFRELRLSAVSEQI